MAASVLTPVVGPVKMLRNARMAGSVKLRCGADLCLACRLWAGRVEGPDGQIGRRAKLRYAWHRTLHCGRSARHRA